jgi:hypothetical protein
VKAIRTAIFYFPNSVNKEYNTHTHTHTLSLSLSDLTVPVQNHQFPSWICTGIWLTELWNLFVLSNPIWDYKLSSVQSAWKLTFEWPSFFLSQLFQCERGGARHPHKTSQLFQDRTDHQFSSGAGICRRNMTDNNCPPDTEIVESVSVQNPRIGILSKWKSTVNYKTCTWHRLGYSMWHFRTRPPWVGNYSRM